MSSQRGNATKQRPQKHKNGYVFKNNKYDTSGKTKLINDLYVSNVCQRCKDCIEWKIKYKKYKPLTVPGKCVRCSDRKVKYAYHIVCTECALKHEVCGKCNQKKEIIGDPEKSQIEKQREENYFHEELKHMRLRERSTLLRQAQKGGTVNRRDKPRDKKSNNDSDDGTTEDEESDDNIVKVGDDTKSLGSDGENHSTEEASIDHLDTSEHLENHSNNSVT